MSYLVLARKYRPQSFDDLVGQEHVAKTLANAIASGRVAHAFLFTGVRGVGKTTSARLLAKCLNCVGADGKATGPTSQPCQVCGPCREIASGSDIDVQEIDGASYNGVDEVRRLQEGIAFRPARDRFKIYIVDEVHMLSNAAWNAFLKTLEEPPPHVKFIFATTEVHKVPVTILSRCQRYDFKLIATQVIADRLGHVLREESIKADDAAVLTIAREAAGSMRDAMSLTDQVIAFSGTALSADDVSRVLGVASRQVLHDLAASLVKGDAARALGIVDELAQQGFDIPHVARDIVRHLRDLVVARVAGEQGRRLLDLADEEARDVYALAEATSADDLSRLFLGFSQGFDEIVRSGQPRTVLEMTLVRLARRPALVPLDELLGRLADLERRIGGPRGPGGPGEPPRTGGPREGARGGGSAGVHAASASESVRADVSGHTAPPARPAPPPVAQGAVPPAAVPQAAAPRAAVSPPSVAPAPVPSAAVASPPPPSERPAGARDIAAFRAILAKVGRVRPALQAVLEHAALLELGERRLVLLFESAEGPSFLAAQALEADAIGILTQAAREHFSAATEVRIETGPRPEGYAAPTIAAADRENRKIAADRAREAVEKHPIVAAAVRLFGAELREVRLPESDE